MEADEFGPMTSAGEDEDERGKESSVPQEKSKEELVKSNEELREQLRQLREEMENMKTAVSFSEVAKQEEIQEVEKKCELDVLSLRRIMKDALESASDKLHKEKMQWQQEQEKLQQEVAELRSRLAQGERDGFLSSVARSLQKKVGGTAAPPLSSTASGTTEAENLEDSMRKAQADAEILKSVVMPLEQEIQCLRNKLKNANLQGKEERANVGEGTEEGGESETKDTLSVNSSLLDISELDEKMKELNQHLETEKSSRTDLEMYVAVLNTQKSVLQEEVDKLRSELQQVCHLLERERRELTDLKQTWQMANDQFLEAQRLMIADLRCMESVLTAEQQRQVEDLKRKAAEAETRERQQADSLTPVALQDGQPAASSADDCKRERKLLQASLTSDELIKFDEEGDDPSLTRSHSSQSLSAKDHTEGETKSLLSETGSVDSADRFSGIPCLSEVMHKAITDPTPEAEASKMLVATVNSWKEPASLAGRRLVSEKEWDLLQKELKAAREKLGRSCDMCSNYESQLQALQENEKKAWSQVRTLERQLQAERQARTAQHSYVEQLETALHDTAEDARKQIVTLASKVADAETYTHETKHRFLQSQTELQQQLLTRLQEENDTLVGKHSVHSQLMQEESIDLPNKIEDMQLLLLKYREDIITAKIAKEQMEENLRSEMLFLRDQMLAEQQEKARLEETFTQEISALQEALAVQQSVKSELDRQSTLHNEAENRVREADLSLKAMQAKSKQLIEDLQGKLEQQATAKRKLEAETQQLKLKLQSLQADYDNSEAVQQDFVKLSQSLQIQLEKIRGSEHEVRWQHEEDVDDCTKCDMAFSTFSRKHHCRHCGKIFCSDCLTKTVNSGPNLRPARVCDVCHTILVQEATPFFSTQGGLHTAT
ncbi:hypothetical protein NP493_998g00053 [Ridgeia piscesae]|uniref:FYVE-type domain-containing protein n=1 Tax=Ridgeia piscesae TaxID=27915 RepID=A0AAD9KIY2_RIDPI|nr:hypothetical protein NP493_998g00053 [Ridgeia piscesae]